LEFGKCNEAKIFGFNHFLNDLSVLQWQEIMAERIQIKYEEINQLAAQIHQQAEQVEIFYKKVRSQVESLAQSWLGEAAVAFRQERMSCPV
jgi:uncharacterized protein YoxC